MDMKLWYQSKTIWFNIVVLLLGCFPIIAAFVKIVSPSLATTIDAALAMVLGVGNLFLRFLTDTAIATNAGEVASVKSAQANKLPEPK